MPSDLGRQRGSEERPSQSRLQQVRSAKTNQRRFDVARRKKSAEKACNANRPGRVTPSRSTFIHTSRSLRPARLSIAISLSFISIHFNRTRWSSRARRHCPTLRSLPIRLFALSAHRHLGDNAHCDISPPSSAVPSRTHASTLLLLSRTHPSARNIRELAVSLSGAFLLAAAGLE